MQFEQVKHCFIMYSRPPVTSPCSQASLLSPELASYHIRPMGVEGGPGVPTGVDVHPASKGCTLSTSRPPTLASSRGGGAEVAGERCHSEGGALPGAVHQQTLFSDQEGWILSTYSKPQAFEPVHCQGSLQDGRDQHAEGPAVGERLDGLH